MSRPDVSRGRVIIERWLALAEERLDYLTELFETGRWRRFFTEQVFLENIREAKAAVETWRLLASQEALPDNTTVDLSWLDSKRPLRPRQPVMPEVSATKARPALPTFARSAPSEDIRIAPPPPFAPEPRLVPPPVAVSADLAARADADPSGWEQAFDVAAMAQRYPLLRNTF